MSEFFPDLVDYETEHTLRAYQGNINSCTRFGGIHFVECMAHRAGVFEQYSYRFQWYYRATGALSAEGVIQTINMAGLALEADDPYLIGPDLEPIDMDRIPSVEAMFSAAARRHQFQIARVNGKEEIMRALCQGSPLISGRVYPGGAEHCECIIGYQKDLGVKIHGSSGDIYWEPWSSVPLVITQTWRCVKGPWALRPHPDYVPAPAPEWRGDHLYLPKLTVVGPKISRFVDAKVYFVDGAYGTPTINSLEIGELDSVYWTRSGILDLPNLLLGGVVYDKVRLVGPVFDFTKMSGTEV